MIKRIIHHKLYRRLVLFFLSLLVSTMLLLTKDTLFSILDFEVSFYSGQKNDKGIYQLSDYTFQVNRLINHQSIMVGDKVMNRYPPVYAYMLYGAYLVSDSIGMKYQHAVYILSMLLVALATVLISEITFLLYNSPWLSLFSGLLFATHPYNLSGVVKVLSYTPFMLFLLIAVWFMLLIIRKNKRILLFVIMTGLSLGVASMLRPIGLLLPFIFAAFLIIFLKQFKMFHRIALALLLLVMSELVLFPWQVFNAKHDEAVLISSNQVYSMRDGFAFNNHAAKKDIDLPVKMDSTARKISMTNARNGREMFQVIWQEVKDQPVVMAKLFGLKAIRSWYGVFIQDPVKEKIKLAFFFIYALLAIVGFLRYRGKNMLFRQFSWLFLIVLLYFWGMTILVVSMVRYMYPVFGLAVVFIPGIFKGNEVVDK